MDYVRGESIFTLMKNLNFKRTLKFMTNMSTISDCVSWSSHSNCVFQILREVDSKLEMFVSSPLILDTTLKDGGTFQFMQRSSTLKSSLALVRFASILFILYHDIHVNSNLVIDLYYIMIHTHTHTQEIHFIFDYEYVIHLKAIHILDPHKILWTTVFSAHNNRCKWCSWWHVSSLGIELHDATFTLVESDTMCLHCKCLENGTWTTRKD